VTVITRATTSVYVEVVVKLGNWAPRGVRMVAMKSHWMTLALMCGLAACVGCVSKNYVRNQITPIIDKVNRLDDETARNTNEIKSVNARSEQSVAELNARTEEALAKASESEQRSAAVQQRSDEALSRASRLTAVIAGLDKYKLIKEVSVRFAFSEVNLDDAAMKTLDELGSQAPNTRNYVVAVEGGTDTSGDQDLNYSISDRRAQAVMIYLATRYSVPAFKIHLVGLGADKPVATNKTAVGRAQNRRADVQLFAVENSLISPTGQAYPTVDDESDVARTHFPDR
jgi:OOP family OmpA-OmpF porin